MRPIDHLPNRPFKTPVTFSLDTYVQMSALRGNEATQCHIYPDKKQIWVIDVFGKLKQQLIATVGYPEI